MSENLSRAVPASAGRVSPAAREDTSDTVDAGPALPDITSLRGGSSRKAYDDAGDAADDDFDNDCDDDDMLMLMITRMMILMMVLLMLVM